PLTAGYKFLSAGRFSLAASAGGQVNILVKGKTTTHVNTDYRVSAHTHGIKPVYFSLLTGITAEMTLKRGLSLTLGPTGQFSMSSVNKSSSVKTRPNYLNLSAGVKLKL
ncbi:MAG: hypothetical protein JNN00_16635, partial [Chitinophagaceae bacterium]|nr:hypothetical protein [Chitinophagaceae bacterium]